MSDMPWREAIERVLSESGQAMHYSEIAEQAVSLGFRESVGATPANTVASQISISINAEGEASPFVRVSKGVYQLREHLTEDPVQGRRPGDAAGEDAAPDAQGAIINAFGMFWNRDTVLWKRSPKLYGRQQIGADPVDFAEQKGVYILHDGKETVYVGRSVDRPLGLRLFEHTLDRLNGRWNRFSWFGMLAVTDDGKLVESVPECSAGMIIATLEALLIEGLEPPQNRKRGDDFNAREYLQAEDPDLQAENERRVVDTLLQRIRS